MFALGEAYVATLFHHIDRLEEKVQRLRGEVEEQALQISYLEEEVAELELPSGPLPLDHIPAVPVEPSTTPPPTP